MDDASRSAGKARGYSILVVGLALILGGSLVLLLSAQFESATTVNAVPVGAILFLAGMIASVYGVRRALPDAARFEMLAAGVLLVAAGLLLLLGTPVRRLLQVETEVLGTIAALAGIGMGIAELKAMRGRGVTLASFAEKSSVVSAVACAVIIVLLCRAILGVVLDPATNAFALKAILLSAAVIVIVIESIARSLLSRGECETDDGDERDVAIRQRAAAAAHTTLLAFLVPLVVSVALLPQSWIPQATMSSIGLQLLVIVMLSELVRHLTAAWQYRRDRA